MSLSQTFLEYIAGGYRRPGSSQRPDPIERLHAAITRQFVQRSGALYELCTSAAITPLRGVIGRRERQRRIDGVRNLLAVLAAFVDHMALSQTPGRGYLIGRAVRITLVARSLTMRMRTLERHLRDLQAIGLVEVIQRAGGRVAVKFVCTKLVIAAGALRAFGKAAQQQTAKERAEEASAIAALATIFAAAVRPPAPAEAQRGRRTAPAPKPPDDPLPPAPADVQACMLAIRAKLGISA